MIQALGPCIIKLIAAVINSVTEKASVFVKAIKKLIAIAKALAYYITEVMKTLKSFMIQASEACTIKTMVL
jgi:hypothetical protein